MLVSFALTNYACFRDRQEFSAEAVARADGAWAFDTGVRRCPRLNRVSAIYGPNGSGKSRFVRGLAFAARFIVGSSKESQTGDEIPYQPFLFDTETRARPTTFELSFIEAGTAYEYGFAVDRRRVHAEWLLAWPPGGRMRQLLERVYDPQTERERWTFGPSVRGRKETWRSSTRPNALLVSAAAQLNSEPFSPVVSWCRKLNVLTPGNLPPHFTIAKITEGDESKSRVMALLRDADIAVTDVAVRKEKQRVEDLRPMLPPAVTERLTDDGSATVDLLDVRIRHRDPQDEGSHLLRLEEESDGTQRLFALAGPWLDIMDHDRVVVIDELDRSLHPLLVASLIRRINSRPGGGEKRAQLIATLHGTTLLNDALERGQIWFTQKDRSEAARLKPLSDFRPRSGEALMRGYLGGRYGGVPVIIESDS